MAEKTRVVAARLVRLEFLSKGTEALSARTKHALVSTVHWPRYAYQARTTAREVEIGGAVREYGGGLDWIDAVLFKENVQLPSAVTFSLSTPLSSDAIAKIVAATAKAGAAMLGDVAQDSAATIALGKIATAPFDALATILAGATDPTELGRASLVFDEELLSVGGERTIEFIAREDVVSRMVSSPTSATARRRKTVLRKGGVAARATVAFDALG